MKKKEFEALESRLLSYLPGFFVRGGLLILPPVSPVLRGIAFEGSSFDKSSFTVTAFLLPLCVPTDHLDFNFGTRILHPKGGDRWNATNSDLVGELGAALKLQATPFLSRVKSLLDFVDTARTFPQANPNIRKAIAYSLARSGRITEAVEVLDQLLEQLDRTKFAPPLERADAFCQRFGLRVPVLLAPMAGACPPALSAAVANAGGLGACGAVLMQPPAIHAWASELRARTPGPFQINLWVPDPAPHRDAASEAALLAFLACWGPAVGPDAGDATPPDFAGQCEALFDIAPPIVSSVMGLYPPDVVDRLKARGISWWANVSTVAEARAAELAGAEVIVAQGMEAGGHRGCFDASRAEATMVGLFSLIPAIVDAVRVPVVATGGIADGRGAAAALLLGASAVQIGTGFLRSPEAAMPPAWADALATTAPEGTMISRAFSGRAGRCIETAYALAAASPGVPKPAPYPVQRGLTKAMREAAVTCNDLHRMQAWAGQSCMLARAEPAADIVETIGAQLVALLSAGPEGFPRME